jgi:hypothetical protein
VQAEGQAGDGLIHQVLVELQGRLQHHKCSSDWVLPSKTPRELAIGSSFIRPFHHFIHHFMKLMGVPLSSRNQWHVQRAALH